MPARMLKELLESRHIRYATIPHTPAYTAQEVAASTHIKGRELAKTVIIKVDGRLAMAVLPAPLHLSLERLRRNIGGTRDVELASEVEFKDMFP